MDFGIWCTFLKNDINERMPKRMDASRDESAGPSITYPLETKNGKVLIVRDFFPRLSSSKFDFAWASCTVSYRPYFVLSALGNDGIVQRDHACGVSNRKNIELWLNQVKNDILGTKYRACMKVGWNEALAELTRRPTTMGVASADGSVATDFTFNGKSPVCQDDAREILFGDEVTGMVKRGELKQPFALLFMWGYYLTMENCGVEWAERSTEKYIADEKFQVTLVDGCAGGKSMKHHGWYRIASKLAVNSYHTQLRKQQKKAWGMTFEITMRTNAKAVTEDGSIFEVVDIGEYLPQRVIAEIQRVDETKFVIRRCGGPAMDNREKLRLKIDDLFGWANERGIDNATVLREAENIIDEDGSGTFDSPVNTATVVTDGATLDYVGLGVKVDEPGIILANEATMAPRPIKHRRSEAASSVAKLKSTIAVETQYNPRKPGKTKNDTGGGNKNNSNNKHSGSQTEKKKKTRANIASFINSQSKVKSRQFV